MKREVMPKAYRLKYSGVLFSVILYFLLFLVWLIAKDHMTAKKFEELQVFVLAAMMIWSMIFIIFIYRFAVTNKKIRLRRKCIKNAVACADGTITDMEDKTISGKLYHRLSVSYTDPRDEEEKSVQSAWYDRDMSTFRDNPAYEVKVHIRKSKKPIVSVYRLVETEPKAV